MSQSAKKQYLMAILERYHKSSKTEKGIILDEFCAICDYNRKYAIRRLNAQITIPLTKRGRKLLGFLIILHPTIFYSLAFHRL